MKKLLIGLSLLGAFSFSNAQYDRAEVWQKIKDAYNPTSGQVQNLFLTTASVAAIGASTSLYTVNIILNGRFVEVRQDGYQYVKLLNYLYVKDYPAHKYEFADAFNYWNTPDDVPSFTCNYVQLYNTSGGEAWRGTCADFYSTSFIWEYRVHGGTQANTWKGEIRSAMVYAKDMAGSTGSNCQTATLATGWTLIIDNQPNELRQQTLTFARATGMGLLQPIAKEGARCRNFRDVMNRGASVQGAKNAIAELESNPVDPPSDYFSFSIPVSFEPNPNGDEGDPNGNPNAGGTTVDTDSEPGACQQIAGNWFTKFWANIENTFTCVFVPSQTVAERTEILQDEGELKYPFAYVAWVDDISDSIATLKTGVSTYTNMGQGTTMSLCLSLVQPLFSMNQTINGDGGITDLVVNFDMPVCESPTYMWWLENGYEWLKVIIPMMFAFAAFGIIKGS